MMPLTKAWDVARLGLHSLTVHKARSALTATGIIFGVWSVISMLAINEGASYQAQLYLRELGSDNIIIESQKPPAEESKASAAGGALSYGLKRTEVAMLTDGIPGILRTVIAHRTLKYAHVAQRNLSVTVVATEPDYAKVARVDIVAGRFITPSDMLRGKPYCVITRALGKRLFPVVDPLGKTVRLGGEPFIVVGVLARLPQTLVGQSGDIHNYVIIPLTADRRRFGEFTVMWGQGGSTYEKVEVSQIILQMKDEDAVRQGAAVARSVLERKHETADYSVKVPQELLEQQEKQRRLWNIVFLTITSVSLLVGGIGIMNIMLASVTERTREIGVRRALGAKRKDIVVQFLVESVTLTTAGGLVGIGVGTLLPTLIETMLEFKTIISPLTLVLPFAMAIVVGLVSGIYPAMRAAALDPIVALRHE